MNKRRLRARKAALRAAYNEELRKMNVLDTPKEDKLTKAQIIEKLAELGIEANNNLKKDELLKLLDEANTQDSEINEDITPEENTDNTERQTVQDDTLDTPKEEVVIEEVEIDEINPENNTINENNEDVADSTPVDGTIEEIEV